jgi:endonuclease/exonuclease/phosphatase family metal-dependent hydrolase
MTSKVKVVSWNILASEWITKNNYPDINKTILFNHKQRIKTIIHKLKNYNSDIILLQEVMPDEYKVIQKNFKDEYNITPIKPIKWSYKNTNTHKNESGNVILLRKTNYNNIKIYDMDFCEFCDFCSIAQCNHIETNKLITIYNIHLDDMSSTKRNTQIKKLLEVDNEINKSHSPSIIGGDFNQNYNATSKLYSIPKFIVHNLCNTYYLDKKKINIDNILTRGFKIDKTDSKCVKLEDDNEDIFKKIGSDHISIVAKILL